MKWCILYELALVLFRLLAILVVGQHQPFVQPKSWPCSLPLDLSGQAVTVDLLVLLKGAES